MATAIICDLRMSAMQSYVLMLDVYICSQFSYFRSHIGRIQRAGVIFEVLHLMYNAMPKIVKFLQQRTTACINLDETF